MFRSFHHPKIRIFSWYEQHFMHHKQTCQAIFTSIFNRHNSDDSTRVGQFWWRKQLFLKSRPFAIGLRRAFAWKAANFCVSTAICWNCWIEHLVVTYVGGEKQESSAYITSFAKASYQSGLFSRGDTNQGSSSIELSCLVLLFFEFHTEAFVARLDVKLRICQSTQRIIILPAQRWYIGRNLIFRCRQIKARVIILVPFFRLEMLKAWTLGDTNLRIQ